MRVQQKQEEKNAFCRTFLLSFPPLFKMQSSSLVIENLNILLLQLFSLLISQFAVVCCGLICLTKLNEHCCGGGQEKLYS